MTLASLIIAALSIRTNLFASAACDTIKFVLNLILFTLIVVLFLQHRFTRRIKKVLRKIEGLGRLQDQVHDLGRTTKALMKQLNSMKKNDALVINQLEKVAYWSCKQDNELKRQVEALGDTMGGLIKSVGDLHMRLAALSVDMQIKQHLADLGKPMERMIGTNTDEANERVTGSEGSEHGEANNKQRYTPEFTGNESAAADVVSAHTGASSVVSEPGSDWETVAIRIDRQFPRLASYDD